MIFHRSSAISRSFVAVAVTFGLALVTAPLHATDYETNFTWQGGISNTRHNLSMAGGANAAGFVMNSYRNDYGEVCVYCHTPHAANTQGAIAKAPLWNRTNLTTTYQTYSSLTLTGTAVAPGSASLTCLSCHDGTVAIDSIINMPGSGRYSAASQASHQEGFLDSWTGYSGRSHLAIGAISPGPTSGQITGCMTCHSAGEGDFSYNGNMSFATDFSVFKIGTDLRDDHPVGVAYPDNTEFNQTGLNGCGSGIKCFDGNGNSRADGNEVRLYDSGQGFKVECASCHDPHGVKAPNGSQIMRMFMRVPNAPTGNNFVAIYPQPPDIWGTVYPPIVVTETRAGPYGGNPSGLCMTCHVK